MFSKIFRPSKNPPNGGFLPFGEGARGFTLIELVIVIVLIGILSIVMLPRWSGNSGFDERGFRDSIVSGLRYAQKSAIAAHRTTCALFSTTGATFQISSGFGVADCLTGAALIGPDGKPLLVTAPANVAFPVAPASVLFDAAGRPVDALGAAVAATTSISVPGLPAALAITVEAETGYVH